MKHSLKSRKSKKKQWKTMRIDQNKKIRKKWKKKKNEKIMNNRKEET